MKICTKCKINKELSDFHFRKKSKDGYSSTCKICSNSYVEEFKRTKIGLISKIYDNQIYSSIKRKHEPPTYTKQELSEWLLNDWLFDLLYQNWTNLGHQKSIIPSIDRLNDDETYTFDNIQIVTWIENKYKKDYCQRSGKLNASSQIRKVHQYSLHGKFIKTFISAHEASLITGVSRGNIPTCCNGKRKSAGGFKWSYSLLDDR